ncbi:MAG: hypothetical protein ACO329_09925 [Steroidobacteraceae bacterium]
MPPIGLGIMLSVIVAATSIGTLYAAPSGSPLSTSSEHFCSDVQAMIVASPVPVARNEVFTQLEGFVKSKPGVRPLETRQYVSDETDAPGRPRQVSCKMKTADHLRAEYGDQAAGEDIGCRGVNAQILQQVMATFTAEERRRARFAAGKRVRFLEDIVTDNGPFWLEPYPMAQEIAGELVIQSKGMQNNWLDQRYLAAPPQFRGTRYCHLIAPEYLRRLLLGDVKP